MDDAVKKLENALENNELHAYLLGQKEYQFIDRLAETPTDITTIFINGFNEFVNENSANKEKLKFAFNDAFVALLKSPVGTWWTIYILYCYLLRYNKNSLLFEMDLNQIIPQLNKSLSIFKKELRNNKDWVGWRYENGLWDNVVNMAEKINTVLEDHNLKIFTE